MNYIVDHISKDTPCNRRPFLYLAPKYITIHSTGNVKSTARNEKDWLTNKSNTRTASWHICVDESEAIEAMPLDEVAWHAGDGGRGPGNRKSIAIEMCESGDREKVIQNTVELVAKMLHERSWGIDRIRRHFDWSGKNCPRILNYNNWEGWTKFKNAVAKELKKSNLDTIKISLHGKSIEIKGIFENNINYIPIRFLERLGYQLEWDKSTQTILINYKGEGKQ